MAYNITLPTALPSNLILPTIGSQGTYTFQPPFNNMAAAGELYTCRAIRNLSDYLANNDTPYPDIYTAAGLTISDYNSDIAADMPIVSLQSDIGHWLYVPAGYILTFPVTNGVPYRTTMIGISLPSLPVSKDIQFLIQDLSNKVTDALGVIPIIKQIETSRVVLVTSEIDKQLTAQRSAGAKAGITDSTKYLQLQTAYTAATAQITALEAYILKLMSRYGILTGCPCSEDTPCPEPDSIATIDNTKVAVMGCTHIIMVSTDGGISWVALKDIPGNKPPVGGPFIGVITEGFPPVFELQPNGPTSTDGIHWDSPSITPQPDLLELMNTCCIYDPTIELSPEALLIVGEHE